MGQNLAVPIYFSNNGVSSATAEATPEWTRTVIDSAHYDGVAGVRFYGVFKNLDSSPRKVYVVDDSDQVFAEIEVPANTSDFTLIPAATEAGALLSGSQAYRLKFDATASADNLSAWQTWLLVRQQNADFTRVQFPLTTSDFANFSRADATVAGYFATTSATYEPPGQADGSNSPTFWRVDSRFADIAEWSFEAILRTSSGSGTDTQVWASLFRLSDDQQVEASEITAVDADGNFSTKVAAWTSDPRWSDEDQYFVKIRREASVGSRTGQIRNAYLYVRLTNLSKAESYFQIQRRRGSGLGIVLDRFRTFVDSGWFSIPGFYYEHSGVGTDESGHRVRLFDAAGNTSGDSGDQIAASELQYATSRQSRRSGELALETGARHWMHWRNASSSNIDAQGLLVVSSEGVDPEAPEAETAGFSDAVYAETFDYETAVKAESAGFTDAVTAEIFSELGAEPDETVGFSDVVSIETFPFDSGAVAETAGFTDAISAVIGDAVFASGERVLITAEFTVASGIVRAAVLTVRHPDFTFDGRVLDWGIIDRSIPAPGGLVRIGDARVRLADPDGRIRRLLSEKTFVNQPVFLKVGKEGGSFGAFLPLYRGRAVMSDMGQSWTEIAIRDSVWEWYETEIEGLITSQNFPDLEEEA